MRFFCITDHHVRWTGTLWNPPIYYERYTKVLSVRTTLSETKKMARQHLLHCATVSATCLAAAMQERLLWKFHSVALPQHLNISFFCLKILCILATQLRITSICLFPISFMTLPFYTWTRIVWTISLFFFGPLQESSPCAGAGLVQVRRRYWWPYPQVWLQGDHDSHVDQRPWTKNFFKKILKLSNEEHFKILSFLVFLFLKIFKLLDLSRILKQILVSSFTKVQRP